MRRRDFVSKGLPSLAAPLLINSALAGQSAPAPTSKNDGWVTLFNGRDLDGWYTFLPSTGKNDDPKKVFKVEQGLLHILDLPETSENQEFGYLATNEEYGNCRIRVEFKWGTKRYPPRLEAKRDNGLLYFLTGPDKVWPTCLECQIQETDVGDLWILGGAVVTEGRAGRGGGRGGSGAGGRGGGTPGAAATPNTPGGPALAQGARGGRGTPNTQSSGRFIKDGDFEDRTGWNVVEVIIDEDRSTQLVNGRIVNGGHDIKRPDPEHEGQLISLTRGRIALQAEGAETWYRSVKIKRLYS